MNVKSQACLRREFKILLSNGPLSVVVGRQVKKNLRTVVILSFYVPVLRKNCLNKRLLILSET